MMRAYDVATDDGKLTVVIFAITEGAAAEMFCELHLASYGMMPGKFHLARRTLKEQKDPTALRTALGLNRSGLGRLSMGVWSIEPITKTATENR